MFSIRSPTRTWFRLRDTTANRSHKSGRDQPDPGRDPLAWLL